MASCFFIVNALVELFLRIEFLYLFYDEVEFGYSEFNFSKTISVKDCFQ